MRAVAVFLVDAYWLIYCRWNIHEITVENVVHRPLPQLPRQALVIPEEPENEQRIEEIIQVFFLIIQMFYFFPGCNIDKSQLWETISKN